VFAVLGFLLRLSINLLALVIAGSFVSGVRIETIGAGILAAAILGLVNAVIRPLALLLTLPINVLTLGLFTLVINALMLEFVAWLVPGFFIESFWSAFWGALLVSLTSWILNLFVGGRGRVVYIKTEKKGRGE
jgi:putative membrane protein